MEEPEWERCRQSREPPEQHPTDRGCTDRDVDENDIMELHVVACNGNLPKWFQGTSCIEVKSRVLGSIPRRAIYFS